MNFKRLVLGTAAGALAVTGAQAADLPVVVEPVDYVQICSAYGDGYFFVPGTEGCLRIRGRVRTDFEVRFDLEDNGIVLGGFGADDFTDTLYRWRARAEMSFDHITETEFGQLRAFANFRMQNTSGVGVDAEATNSEFELPTAFIQLGGFLVGRTTSNFVSVVGGPEVILDTAGENPDTLQIAYTASFGNGFTATLALEDTTQRRLADGIQDPDGFPGAPLFNSRGVYGGPKVPDLVASIGVTQGWGSANLSGALRYIEAAREATFSPDPLLFPFEPLGVFFEQTEEIGFAIAGNVTANLPFGNATSVTLGAGYARGALDYIAAGLGDAGILGTDGLYNGPIGGPITFSLTEGYSIGADIKAAFTPTVAGTLAGGYVYIENDQAVADFSRYALNAQLAWTPVTDFTIAAGLEYQYVEFDAPGASNEGSGLGAYLRLQRDF